MPIILSLLWTSPIYVINSQHEALGLLTRRVGLDRPGLLSLARAFHVSSRLVMMLLAFCTSPT